MKLNEFNNEIYHLERLDELDMRVFKNIANKLAKDIKKVYFNNIKGEQLPETKKAFKKLQQVLSKSSLDKEWADEIFKDFNHEKVDLTVDEIHHYIMQVEEADAYIKSKKALEEAERLRKEENKKKKEKMLLSAGKEFTRLEKIQQKIKNTESKTAKNRQKKIDALKNKIDKLLKELENE